MKQTGNRNYYITDHLGSTRMVVDNGNQVKDVINYYPYGGEITMTNPTLPPAYVNRQPFRFSGKELDNINGLRMYDFGARWYDVAGVPMWTSIDPMAEDNYSVTPYSYCNGDPVNRIDPDGMDDHYADNGRFLFRDDKDTDNIMIGGGFVSFEFPDATYNIKLEGKPIQDCDLSADAWSKIITNTVMLMGLDTSILEGGVVNVAKFERGWGNDVIMTDYTAAANNSIDIEMEQNAITTGNNITVSIHDNKPLFRTVSNIQNLVGAHEYENHYLKKLHHTQESDNKVLFNNIMSHSSWKKTTHDYKMHVVNQKRIYLGWE